MKILFEIQGVVAEGKKRGKKLGFPTANINLTSKIPEGIYASIVIVDKIKYSAATFIGSARTFNEEELKAESYILDFNRDIYGKEITVKLYNKIRENKKFESEIGLINQIKKDVEKVRQILQTNE